MTEPKVLSNPHCSRRLLTLHDEACGSEICTEPLTADCAVCELHFQPHFIVRDYVHEINGEEVRLPRGKPTLTPNAVPTILPNVPAYLSKHVTPARKQRKRKASEAAILPKKARVSSAGEDHSVDEPASNGEAGEADTTDTVGGCEPAEADASLTVDALKHATVPNKRWTLHEMQDNEGVCFTLCALNSVTGEVKVERAIFFTADSSGGFRSKTFLQDKLAAESSLLRVQDATTVLQKANQMLLCCGAVASNESSLSLLATASLNGPRGLNSINERPQQQPYRSLARPDGNEIGNCFQHQLPWENNKGGNAVRRMQVLKESACYTAVARQTSEDVKTSLKD